MGKTSKGGKDAVEKNPIRNEQIKFKSRVAAKNRRRNENDKFEELVVLNPWIKSNPPDKSTVIRYSTSLIGLMHVLNSSKSSECIGDGDSTVQGIQNLCFEALDGFVLMLARKGTVLFVNEKVVQYLGISQSDLMGKSIYNYVLKKDWDTVARKLRGPLPSQDDPNLKIAEVNPDDENDEICDLAGSEMFVPYFTDDAEENQRVQFAVRVHCNFMKRNSTKRASWLVLRFSGYIGVTGCFSCLVQPAWSPEVGDLPVEHSVFISRLSPDLKLLFCEGRIHRYMDSDAKDIVGRIVYPFYHPKDLFHIQKMHSKLLAKGQCSTEPYRWMNRDGGWVWMESIVRQIRDEKTGRCSMLCVNYVLSAVENKGVILGINPPAKDVVVEKDRKENEYDSNDAYIFDPEVENLTRNVHAFNLGTETPEQFTSDDISETGTLTPEEITITPDNHIPGFRQFDHIPERGYCNQINHVVEEAMTKNAPSLSNLNPTLPESDSCMLDEFTDDMDEDEIFGKLGDILSTEGNAYNAVDFFTSNEIETLLRADNNETTTYSQYPKEHKLNQFVKTRSPTTDSWCNKTETKQYESLELGNKCTPGLTSITNLFHLGENNNCYNYVPTVCEEQSNVYPNHGRLPNMEYKTVTDNQIGMQSRQIENEYTQDFDTQLLEY